MVREKLPASLLRLAEDLGLQVVNEAQVLVISGLGAGMILAKWMYMDSGRIVVELVLSRENGEGKQVGGLHSLSWDGTNEFEDEDGAPDTPLTLDAAHDILNRWSELQILEGEHDLKNAIRADKLSSDLLLRLRGQGPARLSDKL
jgi:hypothetical protein